VIRDVAVIVPAANEEHRIARCLTSIEVAVRHLSRRDPSIRAQVIVTLDGCHDATAAICATFPGVSTVTTTGRNVGAARRAGTVPALSRRAGPACELWLASTDADSAVPAGWLTAMVAAAGRGNEQRHIGRLGPKLGLEGGGGVEDAPGVAEAGR